jgi:hypothetical protein
MKYLKIKKFRPFKSFGFILILFMALAVGGFILLLQNPIKTYAASAPFDAPPGYTWNFSYVGNGNTVQLVVKSKSNQQSAPIPFQWFDAGNNIGFGDPGQDYETRTCDTSCQNYFYSPITANTHSQTSYLVGGFQHMIITPIGSKLSPTATLTVHDNAGHYATGTIRVSGGGVSSGNPTWYNASGKATNGNGLEFISPTQIYDQATETYYNSDGVGQFANSRARFMNDGDTLYWPTPNAGAGPAASGVVNFFDATKPIGGTSSSCAGGIAAQTSAGGGNYARIFLVPTFAVNGSCYFGSNVASVATNKATFYPQGGLLNPIFEDSSHNINLSASDMQMEYSMFSWVSPTSIKTMGGGNILSLVDSTKQDAAMKAAGVSGSGWQVYSTSTCQADPFYSFVLVNNPNDASTQKNTDLSINSPSAVGQFYIANGSDSGWTNSWDQGKLDCLFKAGTWRAPSENNGNSSHTYITNIAASVGNTGDAVPATAPTTDTSPEATCETHLTSPLTWILCPVFNAASDFSNWVFTYVIVPQLVTPTIQFTSSSTGNYYSIWSNFRVYGNVFLVIAMLGVVFAEAIGGGAIEAYTVKKMLPRILIAAILINLSIYIVAGILDLANVIGLGISELITGPFSGMQHFSLSGGQQIGAFSIGIIGAIMGSAGIAGFILGFLGGVGSFVGASIGMAFFVLLPIILAAIGLLITLVIRQGLIVFLLVVSPIAFALYVLPNTEQYFKRWWKLLLETAMVFPIIMIIAAVADVLSFILLSQAHITVTPTGLSGFASNASVQTGAAMAAFTAFILQFAPLAAAPFAFKIAGGVLGKVNDMIASGAQRLNKMADSRREQAKRTYGARTLQGRQRAYARLQKIQSNTENGRFKRRLAGITSGRIAGYNLESAMSETRAQWKKEIDDQIATGKDEEVRGLSVNKAWALAHGTDAGIDGENGDYRTTSAGIRQFKSLGGAWVDEADVDAGHKRWGSNTFAQQASLSYEMRKAATEEELQRVSSHYQTLATGQGGWGMDSQQSAGTWKGSAFENQNQHLEFKHQSAGQDMGIREARKFVDEVYEKKGSYPLAQMSSNTIEELRKSYVTAYEEGDTETMKKIGSISETFVSQLGGGGVQGMAAGDVPVSGQAGTSSSRQLSAAGSGHVNERARMLAADTGVLSDPAGYVRPTSRVGAVPVITGPPSTGGNAPSGTYAPGTQPTPNTREMH